MYDDNVIDEKYGNFLTNQTNSDLNKLRKKLHDVDWSFTNRERGHKIENVHPYPAKFIAEIPKTFLEILPIPDATAVLDPFCGSGTTLVECQRAGISSFGIDLNPIACLISKVKTSALPNDIDLHANLIVEMAKKITNLKEVNIPNIDHWFKIDIQNTIVRLTQAIDEQSKTEIYDILRLALSSIIVRVSNQESDTRYAAIDKNIKADDVYDHFISAYLKILDALKSRNWKQISTNIITEDILKVDSKQINVPIGMVITSPPYPNAYEYWLYHKYRMWWLDYDPLAVKADEIGARAHFFKRNHHTEETFRQQMKITFDLIDNVLVKNGWICIVIGRSKIHGRIIDNAEIIKQVAQEKNMHFITRIERVILQSKKSFNLSHANIKTESIIVFQKR
ncbi:TPA: site-specific DNA-methyltransferase [Legionella pneumophila]|nr:DNA methyltransferase [Legionella pneumophila subsp. fraseri]HAT1797704.1 site-specific DNA-methyltransferase [Legionella pneumophila]MDW8963698.1 DNA methyltransferase [Legionella pneumophila subsp. fraseri]MDW9037376.1 DNA methyltransferase [Legionella pneumophila subsp. fraseri]MDW9040432.1 DNA methyltransferase [Legionella pneumophila subsp. fraseri]